MSASAFNLSVRGRTEGPDNVETAVMPLTDTVVHWVVEASMQADRKADKELARVHGLFERTRDERLRPHGLHHGTAITSNHLEAAAHLPRKIEIAQKSLQLFTDTTRVFSTRNNSPQQSDREIIMMRVEPLLHLQLNIVGWVEITL